MSFPPLKLSHRKKKKKINITKALNFIVCLNKVKQTWGKNENFLCESDL